MTVIIKKMRGNAWVGVANDWLREKVLQYDALSLYLPAGETPTKLYADWNRSPPSVLERLTLYQLDDIAEGSGKGRFASEFEKKLPRRLIHPPTADIQADLVILGYSGLNGHVAFHEPGIPDTFRFGEVKLRPESAHSLGLQAGTKAITFGLGALLATKAALLIGIGKEKRKVLDQALAGDTSLPVTALLQKHSDLTVLSVR